jgi:DNA/RNA endonuclease YhcR with UshA esterase domain
MKRILAVCLTLVAASQVNGQERIKPEDAGKYQGQTVAVEMAVRSAGTTKNRSLFFLNSEKSRAHSQNLTIVIPEEVASSLVQKGVDSPENYYMGKTIKANGKVALFQGKLQIRVTDPADIDVLSETSLAKAEEETAVPPPAVPKTDWGTVSLIAAGIGLVLISVIVIWYKNSRPETE